MYENKTFEAEWSQRGEDQESRSPAGGQKERKEKTMGEGVRRFGE